jgi:hypothetical protein
VTGVGVLGHASAAQLEDYVRATAAPPPAAWLAAYDREHAWRSRGELAIRAEMERAIARRHRTRVCQ